MRKVARTALWISVGLAAAAVVAATGYVIRNMTYASWDARGVERAGFVEK